jgi:hypothetical protein
MRFPFFTKNESLQHAVVSERLDRTTTRIKEQLEALTFGTESGIQRLKVVDTSSSNSNEKFLTVTGIISNNEVGLGLPHLKPIAEQLNQALCADARPFQVTVEKIENPITEFGESSAVEPASYVLKIVELPVSETEPGANIIRHDFKPE